MKYYFLSEQFANILNSNIINLKIVFKTYNNSNKIKIIKLKKL